MLSLEVSKAGSKDVYSWYATELTKEDMIKSLKQKILMNEDPYWSEIKFTVHTEELFVTLGQALADHNTQDHD